MVDIRTAAEDTVMLMVTSNLDQNRLKTGTAILMEVHQARSLHPSRRIELRSCLQMERLVAQPPVEQKQLVQTRMSMRRMKMKTTRSRTSCLFIPANYVAILFGLRTMLVMVRRQVHRRRVLRMLRIQDTHKTVTATVLTTRARLGAITVRVMDR